MPKQLEGRLQAKILEFLAVQEGWVGVPFMTERFYGNNATLSQKSSLTRCIGDLKQKELIESRPLFFVDGEFTHESKYGAGRVFNEIRLLKPER